jgi:hypothetical protein
MIIAGPIVSNACIGLPSGPGLLFSSTAPNVCLQNSTSADISRQNSLGITTDEFSGILFFRVLAINPPNDWFIHTEIIHSEVGENRDSVNRRISSGNYQARCFTDDFVGFTEGCIVTKAEAVIRLAQ